MVGANFNQPGQPFVITNSGWVSGAANVVRRCMPFYGTAENDRHRRPRPWRQQHCI